MAGPSAARKASGRKASKAKRAKSIKVARGKRDGAADLRKQLKSRTAELAEACAQLAARNDACVERIDHQSATVEILKAMSASPGDAQPVFDVIAQRALRICDADIAVVLEVDGALVHLRSIAIDENSTSPGVVRAYRRIFPQPPSRDSVALRAIFHGETIHIPNMAADRELSKASRDIGPKGALAIPLMREGKVVGSIGLSAKVTGGFSQAQTELLKTFAEQAVIAIRSAETFRQLHIRTNELSESLQQQTATADVLKVISRTAFDLDAVMHTLARSAAELCAANLCGLYVREGNLLICRGYTAVNKEQEEFVRRTPIPADDTTYAVSRALAVGEIANIGDFDNDRSMATRAFQEKLGFKALLIVPLMRDGDGIGLFVIGRDRVGDFSQRHIELVQTFADQAVIAIENARLFNQTRQALERQAASAEILSTIASAPGDAARSLQQIAESSARLFGAPSVSIQLAENGEWGEAYRYGTSAQNIRSAVPLSAIRIGGPNMPGWVVGNNRQLHIPDLDNLDPSLADFPGLPHARAAGTRTMCGTPLRRGGKAIGVLIVYRDRLLPFTAEELALQQSFADQAVIAIENDRLFNETKEALERQTATAEILNVIASSPTETQPVFDAIARSAAELCEGTNSGVFRLQDGLVHLVGHHNLSTGQLASGSRAFPAPVSRGFMAGRAILDRAVTHVPDIAADPEYTADAVVQAGFRAAVSVPMMRNDEPIGTINVTREEARPFSARQIELLCTFADQAVIAIENARLFNEVRARTRDLTEALERQTATADILKVIASSPDDVQPVFDAVVLTARRLLRREMAAILLCDDGATFRPRAITGPEGLVPVRNPDPIPIDPAANFPSRAIVSKENQHLPDWSAIDLPDEERKIREMYGLNSALYLPMLRGDECIGVLLLGGTRPGSFSEADVALAESFRDQAVIAIENSRLFNETREALERQTATADILKVIASSPDDVQPVFQAIADRSNRLVNGFATTVVSIIDDVVHLSAFTSTTPEADAAMRAFYPRPLAGFSYSDAIRRSEIYRIVDAEDELAGDADSLTMIRRRGWRSALWVPLLLEGKPIGIIGATRVEPGPFADHHVEMLKTFADQAVIALQNTRLFNQTQEALERQTATADILKVIASSPDDVQPVFQAIAERSNRLVSGLSTTVLSVVDDLIELSAFTPTTAEADAALTASFPRQLSSMPFGEAIRRGEIYSLPDTESEPALRELARMRGYRSMLFVPLLHDGAPIGMIGQTRVEAGPFAANHVEMLKTFADQAVIAIQNVKLFNEVQAKTAELAARNDAFQERIEYQSATIDVLKTMSASPGDAAPVFDLIVAQAEAVCGADAAGLLELVGTQVHLRSVRGKNRAAVDAYRASFPRPIARDSIVSRAMLEARIVYLDQAVNDAELSPQARGITGKASLGVPIVRDGIVIGGMGMTTANPNGFSEGQIELLNTFAEQAAIAIASAETFRRLQERTSELTKSLDDLRTAQDRLVQTEKLASLGQLTAGIAHEIKNPLNFVNNFAALSAELVDEMNDVLADASLEAKKREDIDEIRALLKNNLEKVVQHGKRADSIVKNMLLHSRSGAGEQRSADVNALVDESLNLAYHGARAEKQGFNIKLERDFDPAVGTAEIYPQEITRVFLNLITNGFYAAARRAADTGNGFEPVLKATTRDLGDSIEIRIRDNGTGIPPEVKDKIFNPFFTTKPAGEGTGLGLSMSHDIVVKQHGGTIDVTTEPGASTEFIITLPRRSRGLAAAGGTVN